MAINRKRRDADPRESSDKCQTVPAPGESRCLKRADGNKRWCRAHDRQRSALYRQYKTAGDRVDNFDIDMDQVIEPDRQHAVGQYSREEVDVILAMREEYAQALSEELEGRVEFSRRFYGFPDEPHARRIDALKRQIVENDNTLDRLRACRDNFLVEEQPEIVETGERVCGFAERRDAEEELFQQLLSVFWRHGVPRSGAWGVLELSDIPV